MTYVKRFFVRFSHFITGTTLSVLLGLVTFPILTRLLTKEQYGVLGLVNTTILLAVALSKAGISNSIMRFHEQYTATDDYRSIFSSTVLIRGLLFSLTTVLLYIVFLTIFKRVSGITNEIYISFLIMTLYLFIRPLNIIIDNLLIVNGKTLFLNVVNFFGKVLAIGLSLFIYINILKKLYGYLIGGIIAEYLISIIFFCWFFNNYKVSIKKVSKSLTSDLLKFGIPLLLTEMSYLLLSYADRYMIMVYSGGESLGLYSVGYNLAMYISNIIIFPISYAVIPIFVEIYEKEGVEGTKIFLERCLYYLLIAVIPICVGYYAVCKDMFIFLATQKYENAAMFSPLILLGNVMLGLNNIFNAGLYLKKKTNTLLSIMVIAVFLNISLNIFLLPKYGVFGAAIATLVSCFASTMLTIGLSFKFIFVGINLKAIFYYISLSIVMFFVIREFDGFVSWQNLLIKIAVGILIVTAGVLFKEKKFITEIKSTFH